jgi:hypothetical protein
MDILRNKSSDFTDGFNFALAMTDLILHSGHTPEECLGLVKSMIHSYQLSPYGVTLEFFKDVIEEVANEETTEKKLA